MHYINGSLIGLGNPDDIVWEVNEYNDSLVDDGISISFNIYEEVDKRQSANYLRDAIEIFSINWIVYKEGKWFINLDAIRNQFGRLLFYDPETQYDKNVVILEWIKREPRLTLNDLTGILECDLEVVIDKLKKETTLSFTLTSEDIMKFLPKKIFLSHKGIDKPRVREFKKTLCAFGFEPWLDEDAMPAGTNLERGLLQGFKESCAAVFFITPNYVDDNFLATEIDYAIAEKRQKKGRFSIITLIFEEGKGDCKVPELLKAYVWKNPKSELEAVREVINALPIKPTALVFKDGV